MKIFHLHIRKTAGTSFFDFLTDTLKKAKTCPIRSDFEFFTKVNDRDKSAYFTDFDIIDELQSGHSICFFLFCFSNEFESSKLASNMC